MKRTNQSYWAAIVSLLVVLALFVSACGAPSSAPAIEETTEESAESDAETEETAEEDADEEVAIVDESQIARAEDIAGIVFVTDEDVTTQRDLSKFGGERHAAATSDAVSFHPYTTTDTASSGYYGLIYDGSLLRLDENTLQYIPHMAESYSISEDDLTFTFTLRDNLMWSDGTPMTAYDWKWTYDQITKEENGWPYLGQYQFVTTYEALDKRTLQMTIDEVYAPALGQISGVVTPLPRHIWEDLPWDDPEANPEINAPSVSSSAYKLKEWKRDQYVFFEANPDWWYKGTPLIETRVTEIVPDQDIVFEMFKSGETDIHGLRPENLDEAKELDNITVYDYWPAAASWSYIGLNTRAGYVTGDLNVRRGINYAIDKQLLTDEIMLGQAKRLCGPYPNTSWVFTEVECYNYDVDKAIAEFEAAGYTYDGETMLTADGKPLKMKLIYGPNTSTIRELIAVTTQDYLRQIGIEVEIQALEWASFLEATDAEEPDWDMFIGGWRATIEPHIMYTIWSEKSIPNLNSVAYINKDVERIFEEGGATYDLEIRKEKYAAAQKQIVDDAPYVFLFYSKTNFGVNDRIRGVDPKPIGLSWNSEDWWLEDPGE